MSEAFVVQPSDALLLDQLMGGTPAAAMSKEAQQRLAQFPPSLVISKAHWAALKRGETVAVTPTSQESFQKIVKTIKRKSRFGDLTVILWICCLFGAAFYSIFGNVLR